MSMKRLMLIIISGSLILVKVSDFSITDSIATQVAPWCEKESNETTDYKKMAQQNLRLYIECKEMMEKPIESISLTELNKLSEIGWQKIPGVGPTLAKVIVNDIKENGPFRTIDDIGKVKGIGPKKLEGIRRIIVP